MSDLENLKIIKEDLIKFAELIDIHPKKMESIKIINEMIEKAEKKQAINNQTLETIARKLYVYDRDTSTGGESWFDLPEMKKNSYIEQAKKSIG